MYSPADGSARRRERAVTNLFAKMNGDRIYVTRRNISARIVPIDVLRHSPIRMFIVIWKVKTRAAVM